MTQHAAMRRRRYSPRRHEVATRGLPPVYRCGVCQHLVFDKVRPDNLFGYCPRCRLHRTFSVATDPEARRWAEMRYAQAADPFYPTGTEW